MKESIVVNTVFSLKQIVYLKTDVDQLPRIVVHIIVGEKEVLYGLRQGSSYETFSDYEITAEKTLVL